MINKKELAWFTGIIAFGILLRILYVQQFSLSPLFNYPAGPDVSAYDQWAKSILAGQWLWQKPQIHAPLYPAYLALLYKLCSLNYYGIRLLQNIIGFAAVLPLFFLLKKLVKPYYAAWGLLCFAAVYPPLIFYQSEFISEALLIPLITITLYLFYIADDCCRQNREILNFKVLLWCSLAGGSTGLAIICHPLSILFCGLAIMIMAVTGISRLKHYNDLRREWLKIGIPVLVVVTAILIIVLPVMFYNASLNEGSFTVQHNNGFSLFLGNNRDATGGCYARPGRVYDKLKEERREAVAKKNTTKGRYFLGKTFKYITEHPFDWLKLLFKKSLYVWNYRELVSGGDLGPLRYYTPFQRWNWWSSGVMMILTLVGVYAGMRRKQLLFDFRYFFALLFGGWLALTLTVVSARYRLQIFPAMALLATLGCYEIFTAVRYWRQWKSLVILLGIVGLAMTIVIIPAPPYNRSQELAEANVLLGEVYLQQGKIDAAKQCFGEALKFSSQMDRAYLGLGGVYMRKREYKRSATYLTKSLRLNPYTCEAYVNLGILSMTVGDVHAAELYFMKAQKQWPDNPFFLYNYGIYLLKCKKFEQSEMKLKRYLELNPSNLKAVCIIGTIKLIQHRPAAARSYFEKALRINPTHQMALLNMAAVAIETRQYQQADKYINKLLKYYPESRRGVELKKTIVQYLYRQKADK